MKKVLKFVKGKKEEKKENGSITPSQSGELTNSSQTPEEETILRSNYSPSYTVDFSGKDKTITKLHKAAWQGNLDKVKSALKKIEIDATDRKNRTALHFAVVQGHPSIVWYLLGNNAKTTVCDENGYTPLLKSIEFNHKECMALLMERGADVNAADFNGNTGLHIATKLASLDTVSSLLNNNANPEISNNAGDYPLHIATNLENNDLLEIFLCHGASVDVMDRENRTPLMIAAKNGSFAVVDLLCKYGAQLNIVDSNGWTAEDYALLGGYENIAQLIKTLLKNMQRKFGEKEKNEAESFGFDKLKEDTVLRHNTLMEGVEAEPSGGKVVDKFFQKRPGKSGETVEKEKYEEVPDSPNAEVMPPYCKPPKSWEMIQAGMIDHNNDGNESKRRNITTLGTLHSRRGSFAEGLGVISPKHTLSLNRRKHGKINNSFAKHRFSFNEEESLKQWTNEEKKIRKELEKIQPEDTPSLGTVDIPNGSPRQKKVSNVERSRNNGGSASLGKEDDALTSSDIINIQSKHSNTGTSGRHETMNEVEKLWISNETQLSPTLSKSKENKHNSEGSGQLNTEKNGRFPSPPSAIELGIDMAKSKRYMKGMSEDPAQSDILERNLWKNPNRTHSLDYYEDNSKVKTFKGHFRHESSSNENWINEEISKCQKPCKKVNDVNRRIREELECYDDALRELAESSVSGNFSVPTFYAITTSLNVVNGSINSQTPIPNKRSNIESLDKSTSGSSSMGDKFMDLESSRKNELTTKNEEMNMNETKEKQGKKTKKQMLLAMREVKHEEGVIDTSSFLEKLEENVELNQQSGTKSHGENSSVIDDLPPTSEKLESNEQNRKKSSLDVIKISTSTLQEELQKKITNSDCQSPTSDSDMSEEKDTKNQRTFSFSPLGAIYKEIVKERENAEQHHSDTSCQDSKIASSIENVCNASLCDDELADFGSTLEDRLVNMSNQEDEEYHHDVHEVSPDASLSSGPIEPLGLEKDSGSDPDSSINDVTPTHKYFLKVQHEWLKCHLKVATEEKSKLEGLAAQLSEKAERLQFELEDAKAATKSREEVIQLLQGHLTRMEIAYSKCLQESVQCRLELTAHEQEIHHLKQLCSKYEEQRDKVVQEATGKDFEQLQLRIITLEGEKEKMKQEILHLEQEKSSLEKRFRNVAESEAPDQQWKERCTKVEDLTEANNSTVTSHFKEVSEELKSICHMKSEKLKTTPDTNNFAGDSTKRNLWVRMLSENLEEVTEKQLKNKVKDKDKKIQNSDDKLSRERESLIISYEKKLEKKSERKNYEVENFYKENERLKKMIINIQNRVEKIQKLSVEDLRATLKEELKNHCGIMSKTLEEIRSTEQLQLKSLMKKSHELKKILNKLNAKIGRKVRGASNLKMELFEAVYENTKVKNEILDLKNQLNLFRMLLERSCCLGVDFSKENKGHVSLGNADTRALDGEGERTLTNTVEVKGAVERTIFEIEKDLDEDNWNWPVDENFGTDQFRKGENLYELNIATQQNRNVCMKCGQKLQLVEIEREILSLKKQVLCDEKKNSFESQVAETDLNLKLKDNGNLEQALQKLKKTKNKNCKVRSEMELLQHRKDLEWKQKKYLESLGEGGGREIHWKVCDSLAKEREKSKEISKKTIRSPKSFCLRDGEFSPQSQLRCSSWARPQTSWRTELTRIPFVLKPEIKHKLEGELNKSVLKYSTNECMANCWNTRKMKEELVAQYFQSKITKTFLHS